MQISLQSIPPTNCFSKTLKQKDHTTPPRKSVLSRKGISVACSRSSKSRQPISLNKRGREFSTQDRTITSLKYHTVKPIEIRQMEFPRKQLFGDRQSVGVQSVSKLPSFDSKFINSQSLRKQQSTAMFCGYPREESTEPQTPVRRLKTENQISKSPSFCNHFEHSEHPLPSFRTEPITQFGHMGSNLIDKKIAPISVSFGTPTKLHLTEGNKPLKGIKNKIIKLDQQLTIKSKGSFQQTDKKVVHVSQTNDQIIQQEDCRKNLRFLYDNCGENTPEKTTQNVDRNQNTPEFQAEIEKLSFRSVDSRSPKTEINSGHKQKQIFELTESPLKKSFIHELSVEDSMSIMGSTCTGVEKINPFTQSTVFQNLFLESLKHEQKSSLHASSEQYKIQKVRQCSPSLFLVQQQNSGFFLSLLFLGKYEREISQLQESNNQDRDQGNGFIMRSFKQTEDFCLFEPFEYTIEELYQMKLINEDQLLNVVKSMRPQIKCLEKAYLKQNNDHEQRKNFMVEIKRLKERIVYSHGHFKLFPIVKQLNTQE